MNVHLVFSLIRCPYWGTGHFSVTKIYNLVTIYWLIIIIHHVFIISFSMGPHMGHMKVPGLGVDSELQLPAYTTEQHKIRATSACSLHHSSWQGQILNPPSKGRYQICIFMDTNWVYFHWTTMGIFHAFIHLKKKIMFNFTVNPLNLWFQISRFNQPWITWYYSMYLL